MMPGMLRMAPRCPRAVYGGSRKVAWMGRPIATAPTRRRSAATARGRSMEIRAEMAGQYHEGFEDISKHLTDLFTYKAVKTVLGQLQETDPVNYKYLYNFTVEHPPARSYLFCKLLIKERRQLGERILTTRLWLIREWYQRVKDSDVMEYVNDANLEILRESLSDSVNFIFTAKPRPELGE